LRSQFCKLLSGILIAALCLPAESFARPPQAPAKAPELVVGVLVASAVAPAPQAAGQTQDPAPAQQAKPAQSGMGGIAGGLGAAPVYDEQKRPITAGGFVGSGPVIFEDITQKAGLSGWVHKMGVPEKRFIVETNGSGVGLIDYDDDGWLDIYLVNGSTFDALDGKEPTPKAALFHNNHDGTFTDVAEKAGVTNDRWGYGVSIADYNNDGWPDIYVGNYGKNRLYRNNHDGTFTDVAEQAHVALGNWSPGSTWGDFDGDGLLDLYVTGYVHFDRDNLPISGSKAVGYATCQYRGESVNCGPRGLQGEPDHLFHNNGDGTFTDVTVKAGVEDKDKYYGFTAMFVSLSGNGKPDLVVGNDSEPNFLRRPELRLRLCAQQGRTRDRLHGHCRRRLREQRPGRLLHHRLRRRLQGAVPQRRRRQLYRRQLQGRPGPDHHPLRWLGRWLSGLR
jgi:hypothetical protein